MICPQTWCVFFARISWNSKQKLSFQSIEIQKHLDIFRFILYEDKINRKDITIIDEKWNIYIFRVHIIVFITKLQLYFFMYNVSNCKIFLSYSKSRIHIHTKKMELYKSIKEGVIYYRHFDGWKAKLEDWLPTFHL